MDFRTYIEQQQVRRVGHRSPVSLAPGATIAEAVDLMRRRSVGCLLVVEDDRLVGIFTERDLLCKVLAKDAAAFTKQKDILLGEGEAARKRLVMQADGALKQKLDAYVKVQGLYAAEIGTQRWVPNVVIGATGSSTGGGAQTLIDMFTAKAAQDLSLDLSMKK